MAIAVRNTRSRVSGTRAPAPVVVSRAGAGASIRGCVPSGTSVPYAVYHTKYGAGPRGADDHHRPHPDRPPPPRHRRAGPGHHDARRCSTRTATMACGASATRRVPKIADDEVLVDVAAAGLDRGTWHIMTGTPHIARLVFGLRRPKNPVPGLDLAGTVVAVGWASPASRWVTPCSASAADRSPSTPPPARTSSPTYPTGISMEQAAVIAVGPHRHPGRRRCGITAGRRVLITGACRAVSGPTPCSSRPCSAPRSRRVPHRQARRGAPVGSVPRARPHHRGLR